MGEELRLGPVAEAGAGENTWASSAHVGKLERVRPAAGPKRERERAVTRFFYPFSTFYFKTNFNYESNQVHISFPIYFSIQIKMRNFSKFSKNKFYNFLNALIFLIFLFFYFKAISKSNSTYFET